MKGVLPKKVEEKEVDVLDKVTENKGKLSTKKCFWKYEKNYFDHKTNSWKIQNFSSNMCTED